MKPTPSNLRARACLTLAVFASFAASTRAADPWADAVVSYTPGDDITNDFFNGLPYSDPQTALGEPTRFTSPDPADSGGVVTPLNSPFRSNEIVSIGRGGELVLRFDELVTDDPLNRFGIDLLVFGNAFFVGSFFNPDFSFNHAGTASGVSDEGGTISVSSDGVNFIDVAGAADGLFPTNAYADIAEPFTATPGAVPADFTRPVNPAFDPTGKTFGQIVAGYAGSGGGLGIDLASTGLSSISYVRIINPADATLIPEIDAVADVAGIPEPRAWKMFFAGAIILLGKTVRTGKVNVVGSATLASF
jgi:hypothetical protein